MTVLARVVVPHNQTGCGYHAWVTFDERVKADKRGYGNPRMYEANWTKWVCNGPDCFAFAFVADAGQIALIEEAYESQWPAHHRGRQ